MMRKRSALLILLALAAISPVATATEAILFESCTDATGRTLAAEADHRQTSLVRTEVTRGTPTIRHNPGVLPRLTFATRFFFFAHQCARPSDAATLAQARRADCAGLSAMIDAGLLRPDGAAALQPELTFSDAEWALLPGPQRVIDFSGCRAGGALSLPPPIPTSRQTEWNACARACADRLWRCQKTCRGEACDVCVETNRHCKAGCDDAGTAQ